MSRENYVICNRAGCGKRVSPPENGGWLVLLVVAHDGINMQDTLGDLCLECRGDLARWLNTEKKRLVM